MKKWMLVLLLMSAFLPAAAQTDEVLRAALYLTGAGSPEELDERFLEELEALRNHPLPLNRASRARLLESGLLTPYQAAALEEYRSLSGDVLSFAELELVDGFGQEAVAALRQFLSLASARAPGEAVRDTIRWQHSALVRATLKDVGAKYKLGVGRVEAAGAWKGEGGTFYGLYRLRKGKILVGDYNIRYGQGLAFWSAFRLSGLTTLDAFSKRPAGITPSWSFTGSGTFRGLAWDYTGGPWQVALFGALDGTVGAHAGWLGRYGQIGLTVSRTKVSLDGKYGFRGVDLFGEAAWQGKSPAGLAGCLFPLGDRWKGALQVRALPSAYSGRKNGEYGAAAGVAFRTDDRAMNASWTVDAALIPIPQQDPKRKQLKSTTLASWKLNETWLLESRLVVRLKSGEDSHTDLRADLTWNRGVWTVKTRLNGVYDGHIGALGYVEGGWKPPGGFGWVRFTLFSTPDWQSRIYCYERDAPGSFTVPACYGTGCSVMGYAGWKWRFRRTTVKLYLRGSYLWKKEKPGQAGLKFQLTVDR